MTTATLTETNVQQAVPFFMVKDMAASLRFYVDGLGFTKTMEWVPDGKLEWCWLVLGNTALMLQEYRQSAEHSFVPKDKLGVGVSICFVCKDAVALYREFKSRGVDVKRPFVGNRMWVTSTADPDGYRLDFESPTDAPEESELPDELL
jgi:lactoylglutathione lyase